MKMRLLEIVIACKKGKERLPFTDFVYFYGQMGAGKSTIARLIDYCFGGDLDMTPALQSEFVEVTLLLELGGQEVALSRAANSSNVRAQFTYDGEPVDVAIPAKQGAEELLDGSGIYVISDLVFVVAGIKPPMVRKSKSREDSDLERLSIRSLLWYCYLDQESMDSSFYHLDDSANPFKKLKSRDVLRAVVGYHQEAVAQIEADLEDVRQRRMERTGAVDAIRQALGPTMLATRADIEAAREHIQRHSEEVKGQIVAAREGKRGLRSHGVDELQMRARALTETLCEIDTAIEDVERTIENDHRHRNSLLALATRYRRAETARTALAGVAFIQCPCCTQPLKPQGAGKCMICGQEEKAAPGEWMSNNVVDIDVKNRVQELDDRIALAKKEFQKLKNRRGESWDAKCAVDEELNLALADYDSTVMSIIVHLEKKRSALRQRLKDLRISESLVERIEAFQEEARELGAKEYALKGTLREERAKAEKDTSNLGELEGLFLDCLVRAKMPGISRSDSLQIKSPNFLPEVLGVKTGDLATTSFSNLGSGGKKCLFKACFAVAVHRLAASVGAALPTILIIDSPMKNISERENVEQFQGFHRMLHDLSQDELRDTQFIVIDKELTEPSDGYDRIFTSRHMMPYDPFNPESAPPPLISYYRGK